MKEEEFNDELEKFKAREINLAIEKIKQDHENISRELVFGKARKATTYKDAFEQHEDIVKTLIKKHEKL